MKPVISFDLGMEAEAVGIGSAAAGTSSGIAATASGREDSVKTNEPTCDMPTEISLGATTDIWQPLRPKIQFSTDLRKELSLDVLEALGGAGGVSSPDDTKCVEEPSLDLAAALVSADMDLISELSASGLPLARQDDSTVTDTALRPTSATIVEDNHRNLDGAGAASGVALPQFSASSGIPESSSASLLESLPGTGLSNLAPGSATVDLLPDFPSDEISTQISTTASLASDRSCPTSTAAGSSVENADPLSANIAPVATDNADPVSSTSIVVSTIQDNSLAVDASAELQELAEGGFGGVLVSGIVPAAMEATELVVEPVSTSVTPCLVSNGDSTTTEAQQFSAKALESSLGLSPVSAAPEIGPATTALLLESVSYPIPENSTDIDESAARSLPVACQPISLTSVDVVTDATPAPVELPLAETHFFIPGDIGVSEVSMASDEDYPSGSETLLSSLAPVSAPSSVITAERSPLAGVAGAPLLAAVSSPTDGVVVGGSDTLTSLPLPHDLLSPTNVHVSVSNSSPALNPGSVEQNLSPFNKNTEPSDLSNTASAPLLPSASVTPLPMPLRVLPANDSVSSPPLTSRFWDQPSSQLPEISLSVYFDGSRSAFRARKINRKRKGSEAGPKDMKGKGLSDVEKVEEVAELESMLEAQKKMLKWQIDEIQRIATLQFQLTGSNPLSEEAMWQVLGVKGRGKNSGEVFSPEALQCLQEIFAIKDTLTKKEARDISFISGASLTQVREYFAAQRSLVRRLVQQAHDEAGRLGIKNASEKSQELTVLNSISEVEMDLGFDKLSGAESIEKTIEVMRAEKGFAGQIQLLEIILRTDSAALILRRFLEKGGLKILGGWLVEACTEQQTSVIYHLLKALDHLPMSNAVSHQMKPFVQSVNNLRFHTASVVAKQARSLVAKWVKLFSPKTDVKSARSPGSKFPAGTGTHSATLKRNRDPLPAQPVSGSKKKVKAEEAIPQESKASQVAGSDSPRLNGIPQGASEAPASSSPPSVAIPSPPKPRWSSTLQPSESAVAAVSVRKRIASKSLGDRVDRRKVLLVEDNHLGKSLGSRPATISKTSRPLSTDDVYKAKKLERLMREEILKSKRKPVAAQGQSTTQGGASLSGTPQRSVSPAAMSGIGAVKRDTLNSILGSWTGEASTAKPSQEDQPTAFRTKLPMTSPEYRDIKMTMAPASSHDLLQTMDTPTPSPTHSGSVTDNMLKDLEYKRDSNSTGLMERDPLPSSASGGLPGLERGVNSHYGVSLQVQSSVVDDALGDLAVSDIILPSDPSHSIDSSQSIASEVKRIFQSSPAVEEDVRMPSASSEPSEARLEERTGLLSLRGEINLVDGSPMDVPGTKVEQELAKNSGPTPLSREKSLSDFYATLRSSMIRWRIPPEYQPDNQWNVAAGEDSKEREVQSGRVKREEEAYYPELSAVPDDPKDPWEEEPNYDDSLTLEIFIEGGQQKTLTDVSNPSEMSKPPVMNVVQYGPEASLGSDMSSNSMLNPMPNTNLGQDPSAELLSRVPAVNGLDRVLQQLSTAGGGGGGGGNHDPDLLALLLRNPELVSQLTSGQAFPPNGHANPGLFVHPQDPLKQLSSGGNTGAGLSIQVGDLGQERLITSNNSKALGIPLQPGRSVSSVDQTPPETMRVQDAIPMMPHPGMGQQQTVGFVPQGGVDNRFLTPHIPSGVPRNVQDTSGWEQLRAPLPPPPPSGPPAQSVINQVLQPPLPNQSNKQSNWPEPQGWAGMGRPPLNSSQTRSGLEQLHTRQPLMTQNMQVPNYGGVLGLAQVERRPETSVVPQPDAHHSQRPWLNGSHGGHPHDTSMMHVNQDSNANRNNRWARPPPVRPDEHGRTGNRDFPDFNNGRPTSVVDNRSTWAPNERTRPVLPQFQAAYGLPLPPPPPLPYPAHPAPLWQGQEGNIRLVQGGAVNPFPHGRELRTPQQQLWHNNINSSSRQVWRGQQ